MLHEYFLWISLLFYALHIVEEIVLDWNSYVRAISKVDIKWSDILVINFAVIMTGLCGAQVGWRLPFFALLLPSIQLLNGLFFHILPTIVLRKFSPGIITSVIFFLPISFLCYWGAYLDNMLDWNTLILSLGLGTLLAITPLILIRLRQKLVQK